VVKRIARYEQVIIDNNFKRFVRRFSVFAFSLFNHFLGGAAVGKSTLSQQYSQKLQPFADKVKVASENYTVAYQSNNQAVSQTSTFGSEAAAHDFLLQMAAADASQAESMHVIPQFEVMS
jgi:ABC-type transporter Mla maintaining outer membrane lipid asymmetry ATPase subunit MlaF